jgi:hypothetical protein
MTPEVSTSDSVTVVELELIGEVLRLWQLRI